MDVERIWTAAELEALTPDERDAVIRSGFVNDPDGRFADLIKSARRKADARISAAESNHTAR